MGRFVVRNCDLLIALWDGTFKKDSRGGTAEIVRFAAEADVPIWWIDIAGGPPRLITARAELRHRERAPTGDAARAALQTYLSKIILPPHAPPPDRHGIMGRLAHHVCRYRGYDIAPLNVYLEEPPGVSTGGVWGAYGWMLDLLAPKKPSPGVEDVPATTPTEQWWERLYDRADGLSIGYGDRYRSSYVLIIALAFVALVVAALGGHLAGTAVAPTATVIELALLAGIMALVWENHIRGWQERWITYRLLAELCRKQMMLAPLGRALPGAEVTRSAAEAATGHEAATLPREAWVGWYFLSGLRCAPLPEGDAASAKALTLARGRGLVKEQAHYHHNRRRRSKKAEHRLAAMGEVFFLFTVTGLILRLFFFAEGTFVEAGEWIETVAILVSGVSAAFVGLRAYTEFALLARQSLRMQDLMAEIGVELDALDPTLPLASQELGTVLHRLAMAMMQEVRGWAQLFRLKSVETG